MTTAFVPSTVVVLTPLLDDGNMLGNAIGAGIPMLADVEVVVGGTDDVVVGNLLIMKGDIKTCSRECCTCYWCCCCDNKRVACIENGLFGDRDQVKERKCNKEKSLQLSLFFHFCPSQTLIPHAIERTSDTIGISSIRQSMTHDSISTLHALDNVPASFNLTLVQPNNTTPLA